MEKFSKDKLNSYFYKLALNNSAEVADAHLTVIKNAIHISDEKLFSLIKLALDEFHSQIGNGKYNIYLPDWKIGSEHWLFCEIVKRNREYGLHPEYIMYGYKKGEPFPNDYPILIIDDAVYSSCNMCGMIDNLKYDKIATNNKFYCVSGIARSKNCQLTTSFGATLIAGQFFDHLSMNNLFPDFSGKKLYRIFPDHSTTALPLFFSHKIANSFGCYQFFEELLETPIDRSKIDKLTPQDVENSINILMNK